MDESNCDGEDETDFNDVLEALMFWNKRSPNKRYQCSVCPYSSNDSSNMRRHKMVHTQERPYGCMFCSKAFNHKVSLERHIRTHFR
ncbi:Zinc finger protein 596, partial [Stegodyphus mimosarum]